VTCSVDDPTLYFTPFLTGPETCTQYARLTNSNSKVLIRQITDVLEIWLLTKVSECHLVEEWHSCLYCKESALTPPCCLNSNGLSSFQEVMGNFINLRVSGKQENNFPCQARHRKELDFYLPLRTSGMELPSLQTLKVT